MAGSRAARIASMAGISDIFDGRHAGADDGKRNDGAGQKKTRRPCGLRVNPIQGELEETGAMLLRRSK
jgi:hypothetical protein